jgi:hypothetical protein
MATQTFFDFNAMIIELEQLEQQERKVSDMRHQNDTAAAKERKISEARRALHKRIDSLRAELDLWGR